MIRIPAVEEPESRARYRWTGAVYLALALVIVGLTVATPELAAPERRQDIIHLLVGLPLIVLAAALIAWGDRMVAAPLGWLGASPDKAGRVGRGVQTVLTMLFTLSALGRTLFYLFNGFGLRPRLGPLALESVPAEPKMLINALLMATILWFLARASWVPFLRRLVGR